MIVAYVFVYFYFGCMISRDILLRKALKDVFRIHDQNVKIFKIKFQKDLTLFLEVGNHFRCGRFFRFL